MIWAIGVLVIVGIVGLFLFTRNSGLPSTPQTTQNESMMADENGKSTIGNSPRYVVYSPDALNSAANTRRVLFFYANWCPICRPADADFSAHADKIPSDVTVIRVNYNDSDTDDEEKKLALQYGITYQHTFVQIDQNGNEVTKWVGGQTDELLANLK